MCAITGVYSPEGNAAYLARNILYFQQNRGQDTSGIYSLKKDRVRFRKGEGKVAEVFGRLQLPKEMVRGNVHRKIDKLRGKYAVGHNRYMTIGVGGPDNAQPFSTSNDRFVVAMSHNGHVNNYETLSKELSLEERMKSDFGFSSDCDVVPIMYVFADGLAKHDDPVECIVQAADDVMKRVRGAFTVTTTVYDRKTDQTFLVAFKDPRGIRPGFFGRMNDTYAVSSETFALERTGFYQIAPIRNGEVVVFTPSEVIKKTLNALEYRHCQFEQGYFSRALSVIDGRSVNHGRFREGQALARKILRENPEWAECVDFVTYIPNTPMPIAKGVAKGLDEAFTDCIEKDPYGYNREFITRAGERHKGTQFSSAVHWDAVCGKSFVLTDDSIVRGDTMKNNIEMLHKAGAVNIYVAIGYPRVTHPCDLGIDMKTEKELIAYGRTDEEIAKCIGADGVLFLSQEEYSHSWDSVDKDAGLLRKIQLGILSPEILEFVSANCCDACVTGRNPTHD
jgi:amidophosphoribosyltransferase